MNPPSRNKAGFIRVLARVLGIILGVIVLVAGFVLAWFFLYSADLPDIHALALYAPAMVGHVSDPCLGESTAIPYEAMGGNLRAALDAAEGSGGADRERRVSMSIQISRSLFCTPSRELRRHLDEARAAEQIELRFSANDRLAIFANRASFGDGLIGIEAASEHFFHKEPAQLDVAESALLAGLVRAPSRYSPVKHADRALQRRNDVLDAMVESHTISADQAAAAKATSLAIAAK